MGRSDRERFGGEGTVAQGAVGADLVVLPPPAFDEDLSSVSKRSRLRHSPAVLPPPAVIRGLGHAEAARHLRDRCPLREPPAVCR